MKCDLILAGVGGQGVLSTAALIAQAAAEAGLDVKESELHGMSQRGGSVLVHLRLADRPIHSELVSPGQADIVMGFEPLEVSRYLDFLSADGQLVTGTEPIELDSGYPDQDALLAKLREREGSLLVACTEVTRSVGAPVAAGNMVLLGLASKRLPITPDQVEAAIAGRFERKGAKVVEKNIAAFRAGREQAG